MEFVKQMYAVLVFGLIMLVGMSQAGDYVRNSRNLDCK